MFVPVSLSVCLLSVVKSHNIICCVPANYAMSWTPRGSGRRRGRPTKTWRSTFKEDLVDRGVDWNSVRAMATNRSRWRTLAAHCPVKDRRMRVCYLYGFTMLLCVSTRCLNGLTRSHPPTSAVMSYLVISQYVRGVDFLQNLVGSTPFSSLSSLPRPSPSVPFPSYLFSPFSIPSPFP